MRKHRNSDRARLRNREARDQAVAQHFWRLFCQKKLRRDVSLERTAKKFYLSVESVERILCRAS